MPNSTTPNSATAEHKFEPTDAEYPPTERRLISRPDLQELGSFWADKGDALSFYLQPPIPSEITHRDESILAKEKIQQAFGHLQAPSPTLSSDVERLLTMVADMQGNHRLAKIVFACARQNFWREYDLPGDFDLRMDVAHSFTLAPLAMAFEPQPRYCIALADRKHARLLLLEFGKIREHSQLPEEIMPGRPSGTITQSVRADLRNEEHVKHHFQFLSDHLLHFHEHGGFDALLIGCRHEMWPEIEAALHSELKRILVGHVHLDPGLASPEEVRERTQELIADKNLKNEEALVQTAVGEAARDGLGAIGLAAVISSMEKGEVRTLLWPKAKTTSNAQTNTAQWQSASICSNCGHIMLGDANNCDLCGGQLRQFPNVEEALLRRSLDLSIEIRVLQTMKLPTTDGNEIAALLRFRSDHYKNMPEAGSAITQP